MQQKNRHQTGPTFPYHHDHDENQINYGGSSENIGQDGLVWTGGKKEDHQQGTILQHHGRYRRIGVETGGQQFDPRVNGKTTLSDLYCDDYHDEEMVFSNQVIKRQRLSWGDASPTTLSSSATKFHDAGCATSSYQNSSKTSELHNEGDVAARLGRNMRSQLPSSSSVCLMIPEEARFDGNAACFSTKKAKHAAKVRDYASTNDQPTEEVNTTVWPNHISSAAASFCNSNTCTMFQKFGATPASCENGGGESSSPLCALIFHEERDLKKPSEQFSRASAYTDRVIGTSVRNCSSSLQQQQSWSQQLSPQLDPLSDLIMKVAAAPDDFLLKMNSKSTSRILEPIRVATDLSLYSQMMNTFPHQQSGTTAGFVPFPPSSLVQQQNSDRWNRNVDPSGQQLPTIVDCDRSAHYETRFIMSMATAEDANWLSDLQCFIRAEMLEVFRVGKIAPADHHPRRKLFSGQVGIRCRFCAHLPKDSRAVRSSAFPSKISKIYQSFVMINRDHFRFCKAIPTEIYIKFMELKDTKPPVRVNVKNYWENSAQKLGFVDTGPEQGICVNEVSLANAAALNPFCSEGQHNGASSSAKFLVNSDDRGRNDGDSDYIYTLMSQTQVIHMTQEEVKQKEQGRQRSTKAPTQSGKINGFGCRYCCKQGWMGGSRFFPASFRHLRKCMDDLYQHLQRCSLCPPAVKQKLVDLSERGECISATMWDCNDPSESPWRQHQGSTLSHKLLTTLWSRLAAIDGKEER